MREYWITFNIRDIDKVKDFMRTRRFNNATLQYNLPNKNNMYY